MLHQKQQNPILIYRSRERWYKVQAVKVGEKFKLLLFISLKGITYLLVYFFFNSCNRLWENVQLLKAKPVPLQAWSGLERSRKLRFSDFMTTAQNGGKVVSLTHRPPLPPGNTPGAHFCWRLSRPQGHSATGRIMSLKNSNDTMGNRTRDLPVCRVVP